MSLVKPTIGQSNWGATLNTALDYLNKNTALAVANVTTPVTAATFTVPETGVFIIFNSASSISVTLPTASSYPGRTLSLKTINTGAVTSAASNVVPLATTTAAATLFSANTAGKWTTLVSNGTNWVIMAQN
jgi:hypothetical protein